MADNNNDVNFYLIALEFGVNNISKGISFNDLLEHLNSKSIVIDDNFKPYFRLWFYQNFYNSDSYKYFKSTNINDIDRFLSDATLRGNDHKPTTITGEAHQVYSNLMELKFAYKSSRQATYIAIAAIIVAIIVGTLQIVIPIKHQSNNPIPNVKESYNGCKK